MTKPPLTVAQWKEAIARAAHAEQLASEVAQATLVTLPVATCDHWIKLRGRIQIQTTWLLDRCCDATLHLYSGTNYHEARPLPWERPHEQERFSWFRMTKASGSPKACRKRPLARPEWILMGELVKSLRAEIRAVMFVLQESYPKTVTRRWVSLEEQVDHLKCKLDGECCRQHRDWPEFTRVFYGPALAENDRLAASVDVAEVEAIASMSAKDVRDIAESGRSMRPLRHWNQLFPLNRHHVATAAGGDR